MSKKKVKLQPRAIDKDHGSGDLLQECPSRMSVRELLIGGIAWMSLNGFVVHGALADVVPTINATTPALVQSLSMSPTIQGIVSAFLLVFFSEVGDKTFFIALLLALRNSKSDVFTGTFGALGVMTIFCVGLGRALHELDGLVPGSLTQFPLDDLLAVGLLTWFGIQTLQSAKDADERASTDEAEAEKGVAELAISSNSVSLILSTFALVFSAEWGDKSFLATTALAAASSPYGVTIGAIGGHFVATILAVLGGSVLASRISEKTVQYICGSLFILFAVTTGVHLIKQVTL